MGRKIIVTSGKGGVGKTTITAGLGICLAKKGYSVVLVDGDFGLNNLDSAMGVEEKIQYDINDYLCGRCRLKQCLIADDNIPNLYTLPVVNLAQKSQFLESFSELIDKLSKVFDYCLIDSSAGVESNFKMALSGASEAIVVVTPHLSSIRDSEKVLSLLDGHGVCVAGVVVNRIRGDLVVAKRMLSHLDIEKVLCRRILACIPESDIINIYSSFKFNQICKNEIWDGFDIMARNLNNGEALEFDYTSKYKGVFGGIRRLLKRKI